MSGPFTREPGAGSVEEELCDALRALALMQAAAAHAAEQLDEDEGAVCDALARLSREVSERLRGLLSNLPVEIANWAPGAPVPGDPGPAAATRRKRSRLSVVGPAESDGGAA